MSTTKHTPVNTEGEGVGGEIPAKHDELSTSTIIWKREGRKIKSMKIEQIIFPSIFMVKII